MLDLAPIAGDLVMNESMRWHEILEVYGNGWLAVRFFEAGEWREGLFTSQEGLKFAGREAADNDWFLEEIGKLCDKVIGLDNFET